MHWIKATLRPGYRWLRVALKRRQLKPRLAAAHPRRVVVGASGIFEPGWIPTDIDVLDLLKLADWQRLFAPDSIDAILGEHVWEHLSPPEGAVAAAHCYRFLKPGGYLRVAVPDGFHPDPHYIEWVRPGGSGVGADDHKVLYNFKSFSQLFEGAGFQVRLLEYFDEQGQFHASDWAPAAGMIHRSQRFDDRNQQGTLAYTSLILDAHKV